MKKTAAALAAVTALTAAAAACASAPAAHTATAKPGPAPLYSQAAGFTCTVTHGAVLAVRVPGEGRRARLADVVVKYQVGGNSWFEHVLGVTGGVIPAAGMTLTWDDRPGRIGRCKAVSYVP